MRPLDDDDDRLERIQIERLCKKADHMELLPRFIRECYSVNEVVSELLHVLSCERIKPR